IRHLPVISERAAGHQGPPRRMAAKLDFLRLTNEQWGDLLKSPLALRIQLCRVVGKMNYRADAGALAALRGEQHRVAAAGLFLMLGTIADARRRGVLRRPLVLRAVLVRFLGEGIAEVVRDRFF